MNIVIDIGHPAQVHFFRNAITILKKRGHKVLVTTVDKDVAVPLLKHYGLDYVNLGTFGRNAFEKVLNIPSLNFKMVQSVRSFKPDVFVGFGSIRAAQVSEWMRKPCVMFNDTEATWREHILYLPFIDQVVTPNCFRRNLGRRHKRFRGVQELSYLHPSYFQPDHSVLEKIGIESDKPFTLMRFVSWQATHDWGQKGFSLQQKMEALKRLEEFGPVYITSEAPLEGDLKRYQLPGSVEDFHHVLAACHLLVTESHKVTTEAALLGTPALRFNSYVGKDDMGNFRMLEKDYDLLYSFNSFESLQEKMESMLNQENLKEQWQKRLKVFWNDCVDVNHLIVETIESYG